MPLVYIVILNYKNWHDAAECLESVFCLKYPHYRVVVIDNDSKNDSLRHLMDWAAHHPHASALGNKYFRSCELEEISDPASLPPLVFVQNERNSGFAGGNNIILKILAGQDAFVWLLNPDIIVKDDTLSELVNFSGLQPRGSIIGSVIKFYNHREKVHMYGGGKIRFNSATASLITKIDRIPELDYISGGSLFTHAEQFRDVGLLPEDYFLYWEETDWCYRARQLGKPMVICLNSVCYDKVGASIGRGFLAEYYYTRNGLLFLSKYKKKKIRLALFFGFLRFGKKVVLGQWSRAKGVYCGMGSFIKMNSHENK